MNKITWHGVLQGVMIVGQVLNAVYSLPTLPANAKIYIGLAIGFVQVILHQYALNQPPPVVQ